jgi:hypothetical protein
VRLHRSLFSFVLCSESSAAVSSSITPSNSSLNCSRSIGKKKLAEEAILFLFLYGQMVGTCIPSFANMQMETSSSFSSNNRFSILENDSQRWNVFSQKVDLDFEQTGFSL